MKSRDFQFIKYFLTRTQLLSSLSVDHLLDYDIEIIEGESDHVIKRQNKIIYHSPTSIMKFLFNTTFNIVSDDINNPEEQDKLSFMLLLLCKKYVYATKNQTESLPVICSFSKMHAPYLILKDIIEPVIGKKIDLPDITFNKSNFIDVCCYHQQNIYANINVHNKIALVSHLIYNVIETNTNAEIASSVIKNILLEDNNNLSNLITIIKFLYHDPMAPFRFLEIFQSHATLLPEEIDKSAQRQYNIISKDERLSGIIKEAYESYTPQVFHQWSQWSMLMGLIEKQLGSMRGSFWPVSEKVKPHEDKKRQLMNQKAKEKNKNQLNMEEMLEIAREWHNHKAIEPGKLFETILKHERTWN